MSIYCNNSFMSMCACTLPSQKKKSIYIIFIKKNTSRDTKGLRDIKCTRVLKSSWVINSSQVCES